MRTRRLIAAGTAVAVLAAGCGGSADDSTPGSAASGGGGGDERTIDWSRFGRIPARTHYLDATGLEPPLRQVWRYKLPTLLEFPPALVDDRLYVADKHGDVRALDIATGKVVWKRRRNGRNPHAIPADVTAPTFAKGMVIVAYESGVVVAREPKAGEIVWRTRLRSGLESSPIAVADRVYLGSDDGTLWGLDLEDGGAESAFHAEDAIKTSPSFDHGRIYFGDYSGSIYALDADSGKLAWSTDTRETPAGGSGGFYSSPAIAGGRVYAGRDDGTVFAFDSGSGRYLWHFRAKGRVYGSPALAPGPGGELTVFIGSYDARLYALAANSGERSWSEVVGPVPGTATVIGDTVYTSSFKTGDTVGLDTRSHKRVFRYPSPGYTPMISDGVRLILAGYESVHAFEPKP